MHAAVVAARNNKRTEYAPDTRSMSVGRAPELRSVAVVRSEASLPQNMRP